MTETNIITLPFDIYQELLKAIENHPENITFKCGNSNKIMAISVKNNNREKNNAGNIVEKWMNEIKALSNQGCQTTSIYCAEKYFKAIKSYCNAVIVSVTS